VIAAQPAWLQFRRGFLQFIATRSRRRVAAPKVRFIATRNEPTEPTMFSRLTAFAAIFAVVTTASFAYATNVKQHHHDAAAKASTPVIVFERVVVNGTHVATSN